MNNAENMIAHLEKGDMASASALYEKVLASSDAEEQFMLGEQLLQLGFLDEARQLFEQLLHSFPGEGELSLLLAETLVELDREEEAMLILDEIDDTDPFYARSLLVLADLYQMQGLYEVSEQKLLQAQQAEPGEPIIKFALGELYLEEGKFLEAVRQYKELEEAGMQDIAGISIQKRLAEAYSAGGAFEESLSHFERALDDKRNIDTLFMYGFTAFQAGQYKTAAIKLTEAAELDPDYHSIYLHLARAYEMEEELDAALEAARSGIARDTYQKELYLLAGKLALKTGLEEEGESHLRQSLALDPEYTEAALALNALLMKKEEYAGVLEVASIFRESGSAEPLMLWDAARAAKRLEEFKEAAELYEYIYPVLNENTEFLAEYGYFLLEEGNRGQALSLFEKLMREEPLNDEWAELVERLKMDVY
ncbi:tetratricopeptide repeat protein [Domibacillus sp. A3M-37]|uniref:tetratricopeptide repeat protein n=1 Tax=Domibacillus sp. A3M-37 TaxID=2962037 RepID=UPI0020B77059|nr:tetratricopeptide repeat protein [Domibacillus sp. A3M-37]MCP3763190.1 tetratricopeptide repeat protein [Domibacillus sp. A3M-37]